MSGQADRFGGGERGVVGPPGRVVGAADPARAVPRAAAGAGSEPVLAGDGTARTVVLAADPLAVARGALAGRLLLTPNARAASAVRGARAASRGLHDLAVREVRRLGLRPARPLSRLSALRAAVEEVLAPADVKGTARRLEPVVAELLRVGVASRPGAMEALAAADGVGRRSLEAARVALAYSRHLADRGAVDPAEVLWRAADAGPRADRVLLTGYARLGAGEVAFLDAAAGPGSVAVLPRGFAASADAASALAAAGWDVVEDPRTGAAPGPRLAALFTAAVGGHEPGEVADGSTSEPRFTAHRLPSEEEEVRWALAQVKGLLDAGTRPERVVLVARAERAYGPLVQAVGAEFGVPVRLAYGLGLRDTRLGEAVAGLVTVVREGLPFEATARLLLHPLARALTEEAWAAARASHPAGAEEWEAVGVAVAPLLAWPREGTREEYDARLAAALQGLGIERLGADRDTRARARLLKALAESRAAGDAARERLTLGAYLAVLEDALDATVVPADPPRAGSVELHTPLAVFGARYDHVFVLGMAEGVFPEAVVDDPVIGFHERRAAARAGLALEDAAGAAEREELSFLAVLHAVGASLTLTYPETLAGTERLASPFLPALGAGRPPSAGPREPVGPLEGLIAALPRSDAPARAAWEVELRREGAAPPDAHDGVVGLPVRADGPFSASQLTSFGQCAFKWFAQYGLRLAEPAEAEVDVSPPTAGSIFHHALRLAVDRARGEVDAAGATPDDDPFRAAVLRHLPWAYDEAHERLEADEGRQVRSRTWPLQRRENLLTLARLVRSEDFIAPGARVEHLEREFTATWRGLTVRGRVDRIDVVPLGGAERVVLTDYKLGSSAPRGAKAANGSLTLDVQLPLYVEAAAPVLCPGVPVGAARYLSVRGAKVSKAVEPGSLDDAALDGLVARFLAALAKGEFPVDPDDAQEACGYCPFDVACRRGPRLSRKGRAPGDAPEGEAAA